MALKVLTREECEEAVVAVNEANGSKQAAADALGMPRNTLFSRLKSAKRLYGIEPSETARRAVKLPEFPDDDIPVEDIIQTMSKRFSKRWEQKKAKDWFELKVQIDGPIGVTFWGDPHLDDDGCNWPLLNHHCDLHRGSEGLFSVNIGDWINNWVGSLLRLHAKQETSQKTAKKLAEWFLRDSGIDWITILFGNHDLWSEFPDWLRARSKTAVPMEDWQARFRLTFPNGRECRVWAAHDFRGNSMWNSLHGPQKAAHTKSEAHIYACGDKHNWAIHQEESASRDFTYWLIRSRGYKFLDSFAENLGHFPQEEGASVTCIINPESKSEAGFIQAFADMDFAADYLKFLRRKR